MYSLDWNCMTCRLCTKPTIGLDNEDGDLWEFEVGNHTRVGQQRRQLLSKNSVTAAFSAQSLWSAGFQGKGVKMGVFDTGIRQDHPHVKNIKCACSSSALCSLMSHFSVWRKNAVHNCILTFNDAVVPHAIPTFSQIYGVKWDIAVAADKQMTLTDVRRSLQVAVISL
jgi:hypothetical protein